MRSESAAIVCALRGHGEHGAIVRLMTPEQGLVAAYVRGARGRRMRPVLIAGNIVQAQLSARTEAQLPQDARLDYGDMNDRAAPSPPAKGTTPAGTSDEIAAPTATPPVARDTSTGEVAAPTATLPVARDTPTTTAVSPTPLPATPAAASSPAATVAATPVPSNVTATPIATPTPEATKSAGDQPTDRQAPTSQLPTGQTNPDEASGTDQTGPSHQEPAPHAPPEDEDADEPESSVDGQAGGAVSS